ncbi:MAG: hypothetical protein GQ534_00780 [Candidatus Delongbacteria bacterium]|nr:hypothetical protein [Candidatus Delongbacteria bacterium]
MKEIDLTDRDMLEKALLEALNSLEDAENTSNKLRKKILEDHNIKHIMDKFIAHVLQ